MYHVKYVRACLMFRILYNTGNPLLSTADEIGYMPRGPNVAMRLCIVSNAKQDPSYFCVCASCPFSKRLARLSGQLANA